MNPNLLRIQRFQCFWIQDKEYPQKTRKDEFPVFIAEYSGRLKASPGAMKFHTRGSKINFTSFF